MSRIATTIRIRALRSLTFASTLALALAALGGMARANHDLFRHVSAGEINGNGAVIATFLGNSADGSRAFFTTREPLVSADIDDRADVYERTAGTTARISPGNGLFDAFVAGASKDGSTVFFDTSEKVVASDEDSLIDIYGAYIAP